MKKYYYLVLDVETANSVDDALVYDVGFAVTDRNGNIFEKYSYIVRDTFFDYADLMKTSYYAEKLPQYYKGIKNGDFCVKSLYAVRKQISDLMKKYNIHAVCAYNASFDSNALNKTIRYMTKSKYRYFLPYGTKVFCIWHMACQVICTQKGYVKFCLDNGFVSEHGNIKTSAETVYAFLTKETDFVEKHTGLEDVLIETKIMTECFKKHKTMKQTINRLCWKIPQKKVAEIQKKI